MPLTWTVTPDKAWSQLANGQAKAIRRAVRALARRRAPEIENWLKANASWTDRSSNARQTLYTEVQELTFGLVEIVMSHGVEYGWHLELANAGRFQVLGHAVDTWGAVIWRDVQDLLRT